MYVTKEFNHLLNFAVVSKKNIHNLSKNTIEISHPFQLHTCEEQVFSLYLKQQLRQNERNGRYEDPVVCNWGTHHGDTQKRKAASLFFINFVLKTVIVHKSKLFALTCSGFTAAIVFK